MKFAYYRNWDQLPAGANTLFERAAQTSVFFSRPWFETLSASTLGNDQAMFLAGVVEKERLLALLPMVEFDGGSLGCLRHRYTPLYSLLLAEQDQTAILRCLVEGLAARSVDSLQLEPVADDNRNILALQRAMPAAGYASHRHFRFYNWFHRTRGESFDAYLLGRPTRVRNTIARKRRQLEREHGYAIRMFRGNGVQQGLHDYHRAYTASWKANEQYRGLLDALAVNLAVPDWTRLAVLYIGDKPAAAQLWFVAHHKANIFRLAYDEDWKRYSPGSILTAYLMQHVIDQDRVEEIDFLTGNEPYKQDWMSERRERQGLIFSKPPGPRGRWEALIATLKGAFKRG